MMAQTPTDALLGTAAKCQNPVVRNALLSVAASGKAGELAKRMTRAEIRTAEKDEQEARAAHEQICSDAIRDGRRAAPDALNAALAEYAAMEAARKRKDGAEEAINAIREAERGDGKPYGALISEYDAVVSEYGAMEKVRKRLAEA